MFFEKGEETRNIWFYQLNPGRSLGKTNPINDDDISEFVMLAKGSSKGKGAETKRSWNISINDVDVDTVDLTINNPRADSVLQVGDPIEILDNIATLDAESATLMEEIRSFL